MLVVSSCLSLENVSFCTIVCLRERTTHCSWITQYNNLRKKSYLFVLVFCFFVCRKIEKLHKFLHYVCICAFGTTKFHNCNFCGETCNCKSYNPSWHRIYAMHWQAGVITLEAFSEKKTVGADRDDNVITTYKWFVHTQSGMYISQLENLWLKGTGSFYMSYNALYSSQKTFTGQSQAYL